MVKEGAVVIDVGTTRVPDATKKSGFKLTGDFQIGDSEIGSPYFFFNVRKTGGIIIAG